MEAAQKLYIDLFATSHNMQLPTFFSPLPDPQAWTVDTLALDWEGFSAYVFPTPVLLPWVIQKINSTTDMSLILLAPLGWQK